MASDDGIRVIFRGVRGGYPAPGPEFVQFGGNTACQEILVGGRTLIFDAGTGIIGLGRDLLKTAGERRLAIFFSHSHHDHTGGLLYFKPAYLPSTIMSIFGPQEDSHGILDDLRQLSATAVHPVPLANMGMNFTCAPVDDGDLVLWSPGDDRPRVAEKGGAARPGDVAVRIFRNHRHPLCGVLNFRLEYAGRSYVYATDVEGDGLTGDPELAEFARGADLMSHDGQYTTEEYERCRRGWGHSTVRMAVRTAQLAGVARLAIIHHEPEYTDAVLERLEREALEVFPGLFFAREGQEAVIP
ncbi:MAG: MBL fold metallo-hydrolase [Planctomycetota bacterium]|nr:MBL fold metallo-hydrolase [Planctomycetota bacterium]